jgi:hypothetical protein
MMSDVKPILIGEQNLAPLDRRLKLYKKKKGRRREERGEDLRRLEGSN